MTARSPLFSVIVPTCGRPALLSEALSSVLAQTIDDFECIVVDDATDSEIEVPRDERLRVVRRRTRGGAAAARNTGIGAARGRYVCFLDDDDLYTRDRLALGLEAVSDGHFGICAMGHVDAGPETLRFCRMLNGDVHDVIVQEQVPHVGLCTIDRNLVPPFDEEFSVNEDVEWWIRASKVAPVKTVARVGYLFRRYSGMRQTSRLAERLACRLLLLEKHREYFAQRPRAAAYQWSRAGGIAQTLGDHRLARRSLWRAVRLEPKPSTLWHLVRSLRPSIGTTDSRSAPR